MLVDIQLKDGDLLVQEQDLSILSSPGDIIRHLVRRVILTPLGYLSRPVLEQGEARYVDASYGDGIYLELGEPFTYDFLSRARKHIEKALFYAPQGVTIEDISLAFLSAVDGPMNAISIRILYNHEESTEEVVFEVPLA
jgi:hypothetical protein